MPFQESILKVILDRFDSIKCRKKRYFDCYRDTDNIGIRRTWTHLSLERLGFQKQSSRTS